MLFLTSKSYISEVTAFLPGVSNFSNSKKISMCTKSIYDKLYRKLKQILRNIFARKLDIDVTRAQG